MKEITSWQADDYHNHSTPQFKAAHELLSTVTFNGNEYVLDVGCGSGATTASIAQKVPHGAVFAIDASEDMIEKAKTMYVTFNNLSFFHMNAENFSFKQQFDIATSFSCLHWVKNKLSALNCIYNAMKENGIFLSLLSLKQKSNNPLIHSFVETCISEKWKHSLSIKPLTAETVLGLLYQNFFPEDEKEYRILLIESGFKPCKLIPTERKLLFSSKEDFKAWLLAWTAGLPFVASMPPTIRSHFISDIVEQYNVQVPLNKQKELEYTEHILIAHAQKLKSPA